VAEVPLNLTNRGTPGAQTPGTERTGPDDPAMVTVFDAAGGRAFFDELAAAFYRRVAKDPVLLPLYPDGEDLGPAQERLALFLGQYWGGPATYSERRGHPRLRMRHAPYRIGEAERDHWLAAMAGALDELDPLPGLRERFDQYFAMAAEAMRNDT
jgi:hemoglobin